MLEKSQYLHASIERVNPSIPEQTCGSPNLLHRQGSGFLRQARRIETDYLVRLLKVHSNVRNIGKKQLSQNILAMAQAYADGVNAYANKHPDKVNPSLHPITQEDVLAGSYIQHLFFAGLDRDLSQMAAEDKTSIPTGSNAIAINSIKADSNAAYLLINSHQTCSWY